MREAAGRDAVRWPGFQHEIGDPVEAMQTVSAAARVVLVEGLYLLYRTDGWEIVSRLFDERWFLDTPFEVAMTRLANRHMAAWGLTREDAERRIAANDRLNAEIVWKTRGFCDFRLAG